MPGGTRPHGGPPPRKVQGRIVTVALHPRRLLIPGVDRRAAIAILDAVIEMLVGRGAERKIVEAGQAQSLSQILVESVQRLQVACERRRLAARRSPQEHLV